MNLLKPALLLGLILGGASIVLVYLVVEYLPPIGGVLVPIVMLGSGVMIQWRLWFTGAPSAGALKRLGRGLALVAAAVPVAASTTFLVVAMWPGYPAWADGQHRETLTARGLAPAVVEATVSEHHKEPSQYWRDGVFATVIPGTLSLLATSAVGAVVLRRRPSRP